jgi:formylglycine-generating enzyme required for sulfatase activity
VFPGGGPDTAPQGRVIGDAAIEGSATIARWLKPAAPMLVGSSAAKGFKRRHLGVGAAGLLLAVAIGLWAAGVLRGITLKENGPKPAPDRIVAKVKKEAGIDLVKIPAGEFYMGAGQYEEGAQDKERPRHKVRISKPFYLDKFKVTVGQFQRFVKATKYETQAEKDGDTRTWKKPGWHQTDEHPVVWVSWNDAEAFCKWLAKETGVKVCLPREAEWEYSCRAKTTTKFYFGDDEVNLGDYAWYRKNTKLKGTQPCGRKRPNAFGPYDMHGLAHEWCDDGMRTYKDRDETDPVGPSGSSRVFRGGSFRLNPGYCSAYRRDASAPSYRYDIGFRVLVVR